MSDFAAAWDAAHAETTSTLRTATDDDLRVAFEDASGRYYAGHRSAADLGTMVAAGEEIARRVKVAAGDAKPEFVVHENPDPQPAPITHVGVSTSQARIDLGGETYTVPPSGTPAYLAYWAGRKASKRFGQTGNSDLEASENRWVAKNGSACHDDFVCGWLYEAVR